LSQWLLIARAAIRYYPWLLERVSTQMKHTQIKRVPEISFFVIY
jgi:hypothetical protein